MSDQGDALVGIMPVDSKPMHSRLSPNQIITMRHHLLLVKTKSHGKTRSLMESLRLCS